MKPWLVKKLLNLWPPLAGAGVRIKKISADFTSVDVEMKLRWWNKNRGGVHFGGSLFAMTDPFFAIILQENLGKDYFIVDKASAIRFKKPGTGNVTAHFNIAASRIAEVKKQADENYKAEPQFTVEIRDEKGNVVAEVDKTLYIRRKDRKKPKP
jgi:acyl-coenzyme A thioesterase PaaI-like protein